MLEALSMQKNHTNTRWIILLKVLPKVSTMPAGSSKEVTDIL